MIAIQHNARVRVKGAAGVVIGRVEDIRPVDEAPEMTPYLPEGMRENVIANLKANGVQRMALISYWVAPNYGVMFTALEKTGRWFDLENQELTIEVVGMYGGYVHPN